jgi:hypothetical protein
MNLPYPERMEVIDLAKARLAKVCLYVASAQPCNNNRGTDDRNACLRLVDQLASSWQIRQASLIAAANRPPIDYDVQRRN